MSVSHDILAFEVFGNFEAEVLVDVVVVRLLEDDILMVLGRQFVVRLRVDGGPFIAGETLGFQHPALRIAVGMLPRIKTRRQDVALRDDGLLRVELYKRLYSVGIFYCPGGPAAIYQISVIVALVGILDAGAVIGIELHEAGIIHSVHLNGVGIRARLRPRCLSCRECCHCQHRG